MPHTVIYPRTVILCTACIEKQGMPRGLLYKRTATNDYYCQACGFRGDPSPNAYYQKEKE